MNRVLFSKCAAMIMLGLGLSLQLSPMAAAAPADECSKELLLSYFPEQFVNETLGKFKVPQDKWSSINQALAGKDKEVIKTVEEKASKMNPNPLKDPQQRQAAVKIFRETLFDIFSGALKANGITDEKQIQAMLDDVQQQKARRFAQCMEQKRSQQPAQTPNSGASREWNKNNDTADNSDQAPQGKQSQANVNDSNDDNDDDSNDDNSDQGSDQEGSDQNANDNPQDQQE